MFVMTLTPLKDGCSIDKNQDLPEIKLHSHPNVYKSMMPNITNEVRLGRNGFTKLLNAELPRKLASVTITEAGEMKLSMHKGSQEHTACLNGVKINTDLVSLQDGAIIALLEGNKCRYNVSLTGTNVSGDGDCTVTTSSSLPSAPTLIILEPAAVDADETDIALQQTMQLICEEFTCPVCMDILVKTMSLTPCGHFFCSSCRQKPKSLCPICRTPATGVVPSKGIDSVIMQMVKRVHVAAVWHWWFLPAGSFPTDDAKYYLTRTGLQVTEREKTMIDARLGVTGGPTAETRCSSPLNRTRRRQKQKINLCYSPYLPVTRSNSTNDADVIDLTEV